MIFHAWERYSDVAGLGLKGSSFLTRVQVALGNGASSSRSSAATSCSSDRLFCTKQIVLSYLALTSCLCCPAPLCCTRHRPGLQ